MRSNRYRWIACGLSLVAFAFANPVLALTISDQVKINEVRADATEANESLGEYIELYNAGGATAYLDGAILSEEGTTGTTEGIFKFPGTVGGTTIPLAPGAFMLIVPIATGHTYAGLASFEARRAADPDHAGVPDLIHLSTNGLALANSGDDIHLYTGSAPDTFNIPCNTCVDGFTWGTGGDLGPISSTVCTDPAPVATSGLSNDNTTLGRCPDGADGNVSTAANAYVMSPTPLAPNQLVCVNPPPSVDSEIRTPCAPLVGQSALITAMISNATAATVLYKVNGGAENSLAMTNTVGTTWTATIPGQGVNGTLVEYRIRARNATPDTTFGFNQGYFVGTKTIGSLRVNDANGLNIYRFYGVNIGGSVTVPYGVFSTTNTDYNIQDATGGITIFKFGPHTVQPGLGDVVTVSGTIAQFNGKLQVSTGGGCDTVLVSIDSPGAPPAPLLVTSCQNFEALEGRLIRMQYPQLAASRVGQTFTGNTSYNISNCHPDSIEMFVDIDTNIPGATIASQQMDVIGIAGQFDTSSPFFSRYQIQPRSLSDIQFVGSSGVDQNIVTRPRLFQNAPNPFADKTTIRYEIAGASKSGGTVPVQVTIYDIAGRKVTTLVNEDMTDGQYAVSVDAGQLGSSSGIYFYELKVDGKVAGRQKLVVSR